MIQIKAVTWRENSHDWRGSADFFGDNGNRDVRLAEWSGNGRVGQQATEDIVLIAEMTLSCSEK